MILSNKRITKALIRLCRLVCAFVVRKPPKTGFLASKIKIVNFINLVNHDEADIKYIALFNPLPAIHEKTSAL